MPAESWPPAPGPEDMFETVRVFAARAPRLRLRRVPLWGRSVLVDDRTSRVFCPRCLRLVDVAELGTALGATKHPEIGCPSVRWDGVSDLLDVDVDAIVAPSTGVGGGTA